MNKLIPPDTHHLKAAEGWLELGNHLEADAELNKASSASVLIKTSLILRWQI